MYYQCANCGVYHTSGVACPNSGRTYSLGLAESLSTTSSRLAQFDKITATITQDRGKDYQHPSIDFAKAQELKACVQSCKDPLVRHTLEMICLKMARLIHNPGHLDSWVDIAGYARCGVMVTDGEANGK